MYVVPFSVFIRFMASEAELLRSQDPVTETIAVPIPLFRRLLQIAIESGYGNDEQYLADNPDVASGVRRGEIDSGLNHYVEHGYFEGRKNPSINLDESYYLRQNPDVARAVKSGVLSSGRHHYEEDGVLEFRSPNPECESDMTLWRDLFMKMATRTKRASD